MKKLTTRAAKPIVPASENPLGLTEKEDSIMRKLRECIADFNSLDREHPDEMSEFVEAIHRIQTLLAMRVVRRSYPEGWPSYKIE